MKRLLVVAIVVVSMLVIVTGVAFAQEPEPPEPSGIEVANLFTWATSDPPDWGRGALYAGLGLAGALVTVFGLIGGAVPGTAGKAKIDTDVERLAKWTQRLEDLMNAPSPDAAAIDAVQKAIDTFRDDLRAERWRQFWIAGLLYALLGAFFASLLAQDIVQAITMGAGWTAVVGTLGLKKDYEERKSTKDTTMEKILLQVKELEKKLKDEQIWDKDWGFEDYSTLAAEAEVVKAL